TIYPARGSRRRRATRARGGRRRRRRWTGRLEGDGAAGADVARDGGERGVLRERERDRRADRGRAARRRVARPGGVRGRVRARGDRDRASRARDRTGLDLRVARDVAHGDRDRRCDRDAAARRARLRGGGRLIGGGRAEREVVARDAPAGPDLGGDVVIDDVERDRRAHARGRATDLARKRLGVRLRVAGGFERDVA